MDARIGRDREAFCSSPQSQSFLNISNVKDKWLKCHENTATKTLWRAMKMHLSSFSLNGA